MHCRTRGAAFDKGDLLAIQRQDRRRPDSAVGLSRCVVRKYVMRTAWTGTAHTERPCIEQVETHYGGLATGHSGGVQSKHDEIVITVWGSGRIGLIFGR